MLFSHSSTARSLAPSRGYYVHASPDHTGPEKGDSPRTGPNDEVLLSYHDPKNHNFFLSGLREREILFFDRGCSEIVVVTKDVSRFCLQKSFLNGPWCP